MTLPMDTLKQIHEDLVECSLAASLGGSYRQKLAERRKTSKGKLKKIYAALYKAKPDELQRMADNIVNTRLPK
jgi:hypothetical protein